MTEDMTLLKEDPKSFFAPYITNLQGPSKLVRKKALANMRSIIFEENELSKEDFVQIYPHLHPSVLKCFSDASEACRELAVVIVSSFLDFLPLNDYYLTYIIPTIAKRIGLPETVEESEELRLSLVILTRKIITMYKDTESLVPFFNDFASILVKTCTDLYPKVKKEACETVTLLSVTIKRDFHMQSESFVKPVIGNFGHQHFRVRIAAIDAIGAVVSNGTAKCFEDSITPLAEKLFDENPPVRMQVISVVGGWMLNLRDRYSFWHRMIPLLLTGLSDYIEEIRKESENLWNQIGLQFIEENDEDLKAKMDFYSDIPPLYPPVSRPNLGCRVLVQRNIGKILPAIIRELDGWQEDVRFRSSQLLFWLVLCAEEGIIQHANLIIQAFLRGAKDDDKRVTLAIFSAARLFGYFVKPEIWWTLIKPELDNWSTLVVLSYVLKGSHCDHLVGGQLKDILKELSDPDRCRTRKINYQMGLIRVCESLMDVCAKKIGSRPQQLFIISFTVYAMAADNNVEFHAFSQLSKLKSLLECGPEMSSLYAIFIRPILTDITSETATWTLLHPDRCILTALLTNAGSSLCRYFHLLAPLLIECLATPEVGAEVKLKMFTTLSAYLLKRKENFKDAEPDKLQAFLSIILKEAVMPNLVWSAGRTAEAIRTSAICCVCAALQQQKATEMGHGDDSEKTIDMFPTKEELEPFLDQLTPLVIGLLDDNSAVTREYSLRALCSIAKLAKQKNCFTADHLHKTYHVVLKRLDDSNERVREGAVETICILYRCRPEPYDLMTFSPHIEALYSAMLIHLDDPDEKFSKKMTEALLELSEVDPKVLKRKVDANKHIYRNKSAYEKLAENLSKLTVQSED